MPAIGITGGISTGKTTFCECLTENLSGHAIYTVNVCVRHVQYERESLANLFEHVKMGIS